MKKKPNICDLFLHHLLDEKHSHLHRMSFGFVIGMVGVVIAHSFAGLIVPINHIGDFVGYLTHGVGSVPFVNALFSKVNS